MKIGYYSETFYPFTNGHKHVVDEALKIFDKIVIGIHSNSNKQNNPIDINYCIAISECFKDKEDRIYTIHKPSITVGECAQLVHANFLIRGLRNATDYEYEENLAKINEELFNIPTVYFRAGEYGYISSSMVKELIKYDLDYKKYIPESIYNFLNMSKI